MRTALQKRIEALEETFVTEGVTLFFADGTSIQLYDGKYPALSLLTAAMHGKEPEAGLIARSVSAKEPGGSKLLELARAIVLSPGSVYHRAAEEKNCCREQQDQ